MQNMSLWEYVQEYTQWRKTDRSADQFTKIIHLLLRPLLFPSSSPPYSVNIKGCRFDETCKNDFKSVPPEAHSAFKM